MSALHELAHDGQPRCDVTAGVFADEEDGWSELGEMRVR
jgi:hypothetical protein